MNNYNDLNTLNDKSYIADIHHVKGQWHQYDFLLEAKVYGWDYIIDTADYMIQNEFENIGTISVTYDLNEDEHELIDEFILSNYSIKQMKSLSLEASILGIGGLSKTINVPIKIIWFNQTRVIRIFTPIDDEELLIRYAETMIRRTFNTIDSMKLAILNK